MERVFAVEERISVRRVQPGSVKGKACSARTEVVPIECPVCKRDAAAILGISVDTLDQWTPRHGIPHIKYDVNGSRANNGKVLYLSSDLLEFRARYRVEGRQIEEEVEEMMSEARGPHE